MTQKVKVKVISPAGRFSYPHIYTPRPNSLKQNRLEFSTSFLVPYDSDSTHLQNFFNGFTEVMQTAYGGDWSWMSVCDDNVLRMFGVDPATVTSRQQKPYIKDFGRVLKDRVARQIATGKQEAITEAQQRMLDECGQSFEFKAWTGATSDKLSIDDMRPAVFYPQLDPQTKRPVRMPVEEIKQIKGGDWGRVTLDIAPYVPQWGAGVSGYLSSIQFWKPGEAFGDGSGIAADMEMIEELKVPIEDASAFGAPMGAAGAPPFVQQGVTQSQTQSQVPAFIQRNS
jgi:hypothetical protein